MIITIIVTITAINLRFNISPPDSNNNFSNILYFIYKINGEIRIYPKLMKIHISVEIL